MHKFLLSTGRILLVCYLCVILMLLFLENSLIFPGPKYPRGDWQAKPDAIEDVHFTSSDGVRLHGWFVEHPDPRGVVLFAHGNGENVSTLTGEMMQFRDRDQLSVLAFDYRGYGKSEGSPSGEGVILDGRAAHQWLVERTGAAPAEIIPIGRSLGGAIAVDLAALHQSKALVLERTFTTMPDVAAFHYPWLPVRWVMRTQLDSLNRIREYRGPLLQCHGDADRVAPYYLGERLFEACPSSDKTMITDSQGGHNDPYSAKYLKAQEEFLRRVTDASPNTKGNSDRDD